MIRVTVHDTNHVSIHYTPGWFARWLLGRRECDYEAWRMPSIGGTSIWIDADNREVGKRVLSEIYDEMHWLAIKHRAEQLVDHIARHR